MVARFWTEQKDWQAEDNVTTTMVSAIINYLDDYTGLESGAPVWVNYLGVGGVQYTVVPIAGERIVETYITGATVREFPFAFQSVESTADQLARLESIGFYEAFSEWLDQQTIDGNLPTLDTGKTAIEISANTWGFLFEQGQSDNGIYQITCKLIYEQVAGSKTPEGD